MTTTNISLIRLIDAMNERPIAFNRHYVSLGCGLSGAVMLSQIVYWSKRSSNGGWFYKTIEQWEEETGLTRYEQETARKKLRDLGFIVEQKKGVPCKVHFKLQQENLYKALIKLSSNSENNDEKDGENNDDSVCGNPANQFGEIQQTGLGESSKLDCGNPASSDAGIPQTNTESTHRVQQRSNKSTFSTDFEKFWNAYPSCKRKTKKLEASKTFKKYRQEFDLDFMLAILGEFCKSEQWINHAGDFIPAPQVWLNQRQWENDYWPKFFTQNQNLQQQNQSSAAQQPERIQLQRVRYGQGIV